MTLGSPAAHAYGEPAYWDNRYRQDPGPFDWYQKYKTLAPLLDLYIHRSNRVLLVGCGNSRGRSQIVVNGVTGGMILSKRGLRQGDPLSPLLSVLAAVSFARMLSRAAYNALGEGMVGDGYQDVVNIDISSVVVEAMQQKYHDKPEMKYIQMDVRDMNGFESGSFDAVIDKGTLDSLMCGHDAQQNAKNMLEEVGRILKDKGVYILITYGDPSYRLQLLRELRLWNINVHVIDRMEKASEQRAWEPTTPLPLNEDGSSVTSLLGANPEVHYIYVCTKDESLRKHRM